MKLQQERHKESMKKLSELKKDSEGVIAAWIAALF